MKNKEEAVSLEQEKRVQKSEDVTERLIGEYEERLQTEPNNLKLVRSLAELYTQKKQFDRSLELYERLKDSEMGNDPSLDLAIANTIVKRFDFQIEQLNPFEADHAGQVEKIKAEKLAFQTAECQKRVEKYPTDLAIRFEMGAALLSDRQNRRGHRGISEGAGQPAQAPRRDEFLAQCFAKRKMFDLAARTLQNAIKEKPVFDDEKKDLIYNLGCVFETMGKKEEAVEQLNKFTRPTSATRTSPPRWTPFTPASKIIICRLWWNGFVPDVSSWLSLEMPGA